MAFTSMVQQIRNCLEISFKTSSRGLKCLLQQIFFPPVKKLNYYANTNLYENFVKNLKRTPQDSH